MLPGRVTNRVRKLPAAREGVGISSGRGGSACGGQLGWRWMKGAGRATNNDWRQRLFSLLQGSQPFDCPGLSFQMDEQGLESRNYTYQVCQSSELDSDIHRELPHVAHAASQETTGLALRLGLRWRKEGIKRLVVGSQSIGGRSLGQLGFDPMTTKKTKTLDRHPCSTEGRVNRLLPVRAFETRNLHLLLGSTGWLPCCCRDSHVVSVVPEPLEAWVCPLNNFQLVNFELNWPSCKTMEHGTPVVHD